MFIVGPLRNRQCFFRTLIDKTIGNSKMSDKNNTIKLHLFFAVFVATFLFQETAAQNQISFRQLSVNEGLSQNSAISISQDSTVIYGSPLKMGLINMTERSLKYFHRIF